jgi:ribose 5-phosphate isomerase RpiB
MRIGIVAEHAGLAPKERLVKALRESGHEVSWTSARYSTTGPTADSVSGNRILETVRDGINRARNE